MVIIFLGVGSHTKSNESLPPHLHQYPTECETVKALVLQYVGQEFNLTVRDFSEHPTLKMDNVSLNHG
jgi:hypothetical protein